MWQPVKTLSVFQQFNFETDFLENEIFFKILEYWFFVESTKIETHHFHTKLPYEKPILRQAGWWVQNGPITKNKVLPETTLYYNFVSV